MKMCIGCGALLDDDDICVDCAVNPPEGMDDDLDSDGPDLNVIYIADWESPYVGKS